MKIEIKKWIRYIEGFLHASVDGEPRTRIFNASNCVYRETAFLTLAHNLVIRTN